MFKKIITLQLFFVLQLYGVIPHQELFLQGNKHFMQGEFEKALNCYEKIKNKGCVVWYNMGNCWYNQNKHPEALVCWKKAQHGAGYSLLGQLDERERLIMKPRQGDYHRGWLTKEIKKIMLLMPTLLFQCVLLMLAVLFLLLYYRCWKSKRDTEQEIVCSRKKLLFLLFSMVICLLLWGAKNKFMAEKEAVIIHDKVTVHAGPEKSFHHIASLPAGCVVQVLDHDKNMYKVVCDQGAGWVASDILEIV